MINNDEYLKITKQLDKGWRVIDENRVPFLREVLNWLGNPDQKYKIIHIAGTNGKGSTSEMLNQILQASGYRVGKFASPGLYTHREQVMVNSTYITQDEFVTEFKQILAMLKTHDLDMQALSFFEWWVIIALNYFAKQQLDLAIVEVGVGGDLDATNAITTSMINIFTKITYDHQNILGDDLVSIAEAKCGILRPGAQVISYSGQQAEVQAVIKKRSAAIGASLYAGPRPLIIPVKTTPAGTNVKINDELDVFLILSGQFQLLNLNTVLQAVNVLRQLDYNVPTAAIKNGLAQAKLPGRMEYDAKNNIIRDAAHNPDGMDALVASLKALRLPFKPTVVLGILRDKNYMTMLETLLPHVARIIAITPANPTRSLTADELAAQILEMDDNVEVSIADDPTAAITVARQVRESSDAMIVITGSFYTLRAVKGINF
ncbi:bifunctional folylpolyglutamate synthase/dihydrofolate synthase [Periweissella ghanensis]|uniref:tetrahydrofolate synthase n=1 Tax=Periweissella ghanensis TaxID=467997 RepID=A0ABM8ZB17_9LACO|nr:Mur ligase family protein [Periweissella ghanensis]MCM0600686.1 hypothetical protein [Periweissella ghanensis]CAH0418501.1 Folylpolyglutamate synthase [Periweissella ghanensis]